MKIAGKDGGVENDCERQAARTVDIFFAHSIERGLGGVTNTLLRHVDVKCNILQSRRCEFHQHLARGLDAIGEQRRAHAFLADIADDRNQLVSPAQGRVAASHLNVGAITIMAMDEVDSAKHFFERNVFQRLRRFR